MRADRQRTDIGGRAERGLGSGVGGPGDAAKGEGGGASAPGAARVRGRRSVPGRASAAARVARRWRGTDAAIVRTPPRTAALTQPIARESAALRKRIRGTVPDSRRPAIWQPGSSQIRKKIIGHASGAIRTPLRPVISLRSAHRFVALLHEPARQHRRSVFLHPLVEQRADFLAEIGAVREAREFVALQRVFRRREKEFPRGLGRSVGQGAPPGPRWSAHRNAAVILVKISCRVNACGKVWKTPRASRCAATAAPRACSACDGDYEDPERTTWVEPREEQEENEAQETEQVSDGLQAERREEQCEEEERRGE